MGYFRLAMVVLLLLSWGCAAKEAPDMKAASEEWRLRSLESHFLDFQERQSQLRSEVLSRTQALDTRLSAVESRLEENTGVVAGLEAELVAVRAKLQALEEEQEARRAEARAREEVLAAKPSEAPRVEPEPDRKQAPAPDPSAASRTAMQEYQEALGLIRDGKVEKGRAALNDFIADNPKSPLLPNALYWLGESFYHEKRYGQAILTFKEVLRRFPKHHKSPASLLKIGYSYANLGDAQNARFYLETLIQEYPESEPAPMARNKLGQLGG